MSTAALPAKAQDILQGRAPERLRQGIAAGAVPLPPEELISCLAVIIAKDPNPSFRTKAEATLRDLPEAVRKGAVGGKLAPPIFRVLLKYGELKPGERAELALNAAAPDDVITDLARDERESSVLDILVENQQRMLRHVELIEALLENSALGPASRARLEEFFGRAYAGKVLLASGQVTREQLAAEGELDEDELAQVEQAAQDAPEDLGDVPEELLHKDEAAIEDEEEAQALLATAAGEEEEKEEPLDMTNLRKALAKMTVPQKIKLAISGGKEARSLLVFDGNKVVGSLVLKNPRITDKEVKAIAQSKSVREDMLRQISREKKFMKSYEIKLALVENAKTPVTLSMSLLAQLRDADIKRLSRSRNVSNNLATQAKRMLQRKQAKGK